jgi:hypothetical protein
VARAMISCGRRLRSSLAYCAAGRRREAAPAHRASHDLSVPTCIIMHNIADHFCLACQTARGKRRSIESSSPIRIRWP